MARRICALPPTERTRHLRELIQQFAGVEALVAYDPMRRHDEARSIRGHLVGVASPLTGVGADVLIVRATFGGDLFTISSATVIEIREP